MKKRKLLVSALAIALAAIICIGGTLAYFTDYTDQVENRFAIADVTGDDAFNITLTEPEWDAAVDYKDENGNALIKPGITIPKDPTVTLTNDFYDYGAFIKIYAVVYGVPANYSFYDLRDGGFFVNLRNNGKIEILDSTQMPQTEEEKANGTRSYLIAYRNAKALKKGESISLFTGIKFPDDITTAEELEAWSNFRIVVKAYAVSAEGMTYDEANTPLTALYTANPINDPRLPQMS